jgi:hypothetical protein
MAKATCDLIRIYDEETERAFGKPTGTGRLQDAAAPESLRI